MIKLSLTSDWRRQRGLPFAKLLATLLLIAAPLNGSPLTQTDLDAPELDVSAPLVGEEVEAHLEVEGLLGDTDVKNQQHFLDTAADTMRAVLASQQEARFSPESSRAGEIRAHSADLMRHLIRMHQQAAQCELDELVTAGERIGRRSVLVERQLDTQLAHLNRYLAALFQVAHECDQSTGGDGASSGGSCEEKSWFEKLMDSLGL